MKKSLKKQRSMRDKQTDELRDRIKKNSQKVKGFISDYFKKDLDINQYRPKDGDHIIDIIPYRVGDNDPELKKGQKTYTLAILVHQKVGASQKSYICPTMYGKKCPICEHREKLHQKENEKYKEFFPKKRNLYNIVCQNKGEAKKGIQLYDESFHYFEKFLMGISVKPAREGREEKVISFADPKHGKSISFTIEPPKSKSDYKKFIGHAFDDRDYVIDEKILESAYILDQIIHVPSYNELKTAFLDSDNEEGDDTVDYSKAVKKLKKASDNDDLEVIAEEYGIEAFDEDFPFNKNKRKMEAELEELMEEKENEDESEEEEDEETDDENEDGGEEEEELDDEYDEDEDKDDGLDDEDEEEDNNDEEDGFDLKELKKKKFKELVRIVKDKELSIKVKKYEDNKKGRITLAKAIWAEINDDIPF